MSQEEPAQAARYMIDRSGKVGEVVGSYLGSVYLRPPGGGLEWSVRPDTLRDPTPQELGAALRPMGPVGGGR
ncbi:hypothetical protein [Streptomyces melanogenes]|uniref:hypothetical protein n=1 Tax=Streptomyces melanogenes TaxID=67326 RepID=UPI00167CF2F7|nr:hypothetical protein [Streptomyces melanogenes]GGP84446.1 hypothetical protein GCM10010278_73660 [Streptomyces melanogenes]